MNILLKAEKYFSWIEVQPKSYCPSPFCFFMITFNWQFVEYPNCVIFTIMALNVVYEKIKALCPRIIAWILPENAWFLMIFLKYIKSHFVNWNPETSNFNLFCPSRHNQKNFSWNKNKNMQIGKFGFRHCFVRGGIHFFTFRFIQTSVKNFRSLGPIYKHNIIHLFYNLGLRR